MRSYRFGLERLAAGAAMVAILATALGPPTSAAAKSSNPYPNDNRLTLADVQMLGTHNSYHLRPDRQIVAGEPADYEHPPPDVQLSQQGIRSLEFDAFNSRSFPVFHSVIVDDKANCPTIEDCLRNLKSWSRAKPGHVPLFLIIEPKNLPTNPNPAIQQLIDNYAARRQLTNWDAASLDRMDSTVRRVFGRSLITPDEVRGKRATLRAAVLEDGWPTLAETRGRVLVLFLASGPLLDAYLLHRPSLQHRAMFVPSDPDHPDAAIIKRDTPDPSFPALARQDFLIKTAADADAVEARANNLTRATTALASGAHVVATDYPVPDPTIGPYVVQLPGSAIARCNPVTAPKWCRTRDIENPEGLRKG